MTGGMHKGRVKPPPISPLAQCCRQPRHPKCRSLPLLAAATAGQRLVLPSDGKLSGWLCLL